MEKFFHPIKRTPSKLKSVSVVVEPYTEIKKAKVFIALLGGDFVVCLLSYGKVCGMVSFCVIKCYVGCAFCNQRHVAHFAVKVCFFAVAGRLWCAFHGSQNRNVKAFF